MKRSSYGWLILVIAIIVIVIAVGCYSFANKKSVPGTIASTLNQSSKTLVVSSGIFKSPEMVSNSDNPTPIAPMTPSQYITAFENAQLPNVNMVDGLFAHRLIDSVGPVFAYIDSDNLATDECDNNDLCIYFAIADLPNLTAKGISTVNVFISHVYTKDAIDVFDQNNNSESSTLVLGQVTDQPVLYYESSYDVPIKANSNLNGSTFSSVSGTVVFTLPTPDGGTFTKSYPFIIEAK